MELLVQIVAQLHALVKLSGAKLSKLLSTMQHPSAHRISASCSSAFSRSSSVPASLSLARRAANACFSLNKEAFSSRSSSSRASRSRTCKQHKPHSQQFNHKENQPTIIIPRLTGIYTSHRRFGCHTTFLQWPDTFFGLIDKGEDLQVDQYRNVPSESLGAVGRQMSADWDIADFHSFAQI